MTNKNVFVTGGSGFVGRRLVQQLQKRGMPVTVAVRSLAPAWDAPVFLFDELSPGQSWAQAVAGHKVVIHCAARVHVMDERSTDPLSEFRRINVDGTLSLARQAAAVGVKRFIFLSSIKVNGESTSLGRPFTALDTPAPQDPYGISKLEAELGLLKIGLETGLEIVIIRPVLVYGPGVKANFRSLMRWVHKGLPLPLGAINNQRSVVALDNLVDLIVTCIDHPAAVGQIFLVSDDDDLSTPRMLRCMGRAMDRPVRLIPIPVVWLENCAALLGKRALAQRLCGSLQVDIRHTRETLNWTPPISVDEGFRIAAIAFLNE